MEQEPSIYIYEPSTCRYVRLNGLNVPHVPRPSFIAPKLSPKKSRKRSLQHPNAGGSIQQMTFLNCAASANNVHWKTT